MLPKGGSAPSLPVLQPCQIVDPVSDGEPRQPNVRLRLPRLSADTIRRTQRREQRSTGAIVLAFDITNPISSMGCCGSSAIRSSGRGSIPAAGQSSKAATFARAENVRAFEEEIRELCCSPQYGVASTLTTVPDVSSGSDLISTTSPELLRRPAGSHSVVPAPGSTHAYGFAFSLTAVNSRSNSISGPRIADRFALPVFNGIQSQADNTGISGASRNPVSVGGQPTVVSAETTTPEYSASMLLGNPPDDHPARFESGIGITTSADAITDEAGDAESAVDAALTDGAGDEDSGVDSVSVRRMSNGQPEPEISAGDGSTKPLAGYQRDGLSSGSSASDIGESELNETEVPAATKQDDLTEPRHPQESDSSHPSAVPVNRHFPGDGNVQYGVDRFSDLPSRQSIVSASLAEQIAYHAMSRAEVVRDFGEQTFTLRLDPPELGKLTIRMKRTADGISLHFSAAEIGTLGLIQDSADDLARNLVNQDSIFREIDIDVSTGDDSRQSARESEIPQGRRRLASVGMLPGPAAGSTDISFVA